MKLTAPKIYTFLVGAILGVLGLIGHYVSIPFVSTHNFGFVAVGFVVLVLGILVDQL